MRSAAEFRAAAMEHGIMSWPIHNCTFCHYECGYQFTGDRVFYDSGCDCTRSQQVIEQSWEDVANHYNRQDHPRVIAEMDAFWHFGGSEPDAP